MRTLLSIGKKSLFVAFLMAFAVMGSAYAVVDSAVTAGGDAIHHTQSHGVDYWTSDDTTIGVYCWGYNYSPWEWHRDTGYMQYSISELADVIESIDSVYIWLYVESINNGFGESVGAGNLYHSSNSSSANGTATQGIDGDQWVGLISTQSYPGWVGFDITEYLIADLNNGYSYSAFKMAYTFNGEGESGMSFASGESDNPSFLRFDLVPVYKYYTSGRLKSVTYPEAVGGNTYIEYLDEDWRGQGYGRIAKRILDSADTDNAIAYTYTYAQDNIMLAVDLNDNDSCDVVVGAADDGIWKYMDNSYWFQISAGNAESIITADLDTNSIDDLVVDFGATGLWKYTNNATWKKISDSNPEKVAIGDVDNSGTDDMIVDFGSTGLWKYTNNTTWKKISDSDADDIIVGDIDNNGMEDIVVDFGSTGLWKYTNNTTWKKISDSNAEKVIITDLDNNGTNDMVVDFGSNGLWKYMNNTTWKKVSDTNAENVVIADLDNNGVNDMVVDFGSTGLWKYTNNTTWKKISDTNAEKVVMADLDGNGVIDMVADFGSTGLYKYMNNTAWKKISDTNAVDIMIADVDGDDADDVVLDFGASGTYKYMDNATWRKISTLNADRTTVKKAYNKSDFTGLVYTETSNANDVVIDKTYSLLIENYGDGLLKRKTDAATGDIYEYEDENFDPGTGEQGYGRMVLAYDASEEAYKKYSWGETQVEVSEYEGAYEPEADSAVWNDVVEAERTTVYVYDHNSEEVDLNTAANGWVMRSKTVYDTDGVTVIEEYEYDSTGRLIMDSHVSTNRYFTYTYHDKSELVDMKETFELSTDAWLFTEWSNNNEDNRLYQKAEYTTGNAYQYFDGEGYEVEIVWSGSTNINGYEVDSGRLLWDQYDSDGDGVIGDMTTYEYYIGDYSTQAEWINTYEWFSGDGGFWELIQSAQYSTNGYQMGLYTTHEPADFKPSDIPAKPSHALRTFEYYPGTGNLRLYYDGNDERDIVYYFENNDILKRVDFGDKFYHGQGRMTKYEYLDNDVPVFFSFKYKDGEGGINTVEYRRWDDVNVASGDKEYFGEQFFTLPNYVEYGAGYAIAAPVANGTTGYMNPCLMVYDGEGELLWYKFLTTYSSISPSAVAVDEVGNIIAATTEWEGDQSGIRISKYGSNGALLTTGSYTTGGNLFVQDIEILSGGNVVVLCNYDDGIDRNSRDIWLVELDPYNDFEYVSDITYEEYSDNQGYWLEFFDDLLLVHGTVYDDEAGEYVDWLIQYDADGILDAEGYDWSGREHEFSWYGINTTGRLFQEEETSDEYGTEGARNLSFFVVGGYTTGTARISLMQDDSMTVHGGAMVFSYFDSDFADAAAQRLVFADGTIVDLVSDGDDYTPVKMVDRNGDVFRYAWGQTYKGDPYDVVRVKYDHNGGEYAYFYNSSKGWDPEQLFAEGNWLYAGEYTTGELTFTELETSYGFFNAGADNPVLPDVKYGSGYVDMFTDTGSGIVYFRKDEAFYDNDTPMNLTDDYGRIYAALDRANNSAHAYEYFESNGSNNSDRVKCDTRVVYQGDEMSYTYAYAYELMYNESFYEGDYTTNVSVDYGYGRRYVSASGEYTTTSYEKTFAYMTGSAKPLIKHDAFLSDTIGGGDLYIYYDSGDPETAVPEYGRIEFDADIDAEAGLLVDEDGNVNGQMMRKIDFTNADPAEYPEEAGKVFYFIWGEVLYDGEYTSNVVIVDDGMDYRAFAGFNGDTSDPDAVMDDSYWTALNGGAPVLETEFDRWISDDLESWWTWVAGNEVRVEFPALSTNYYDWMTMGPPPSPGDGHIDARVDTNDMLNTVYVYSWDDPGATNMTMSIYFDYDKMYSGMTDWETYEGMADTDLVFTVVYNTDGNYNLDGVDWDNPVSETYQYGQISSLGDGFLPVDGILLNESMPSCSGEGVLVALLDTGINKVSGLNVAGGIDLAGADRMLAEADDDYSDLSGHGTITASEINSAAPGADLLAVKVFDNAGNTSTSIVAKAIRYAVDSGARILAMPFELSLVSGAIKDAIDYAVEKSTVLIAAAGNSGSEILGTSLAAQEGVIAVGSTEDDGGLSAWSNYGDELDLALPSGENKGTSFSAAYAAGIAALILEANPEFTADQVLTELKSLTSAFDPLRTTYHALRTEPKGVDVDELASKQAAMIQQGMEFTGTSPQMEIKQVVQQ